MNGSAHGRDRPARRSPSPGNVRKNPESGPALLREFGPVVEQTHRGHTNKSGKASLMPDAHPPKRCCPPPALCSNELWETNALPPAGRLAPYPFLEWFPTSEHSTSRVPFSKTDGIAKCGFLAVYAVEKRSQ